MPAKKLIFKWLVIVVVIIFGPGSIIITWYAKYIVPNYYEPLKLKQKVVEKAINPPQSKNKTVTKLKVEEPKIQKDQVAVFLSDTEKHVLIDYKTEKAIVDKLVNELLDKEKNKGIVSIKSGAEGKWESAEQIMSICKKRGFKYNLASIKE